jgi:hypothetical protein
MAVDIEAGRIRAIHDTTFHPRIAESKHWPLCLSWSTVYIRSSPYADASYVVLPEEIPPQNFILGYMEPLI